MSKRLGFLLFAILVSARLWAGSPPQPLPLPRIRILLFTVPANPTGINQVSVAAFNSANTSLNVTTTPGSAWAGALPNDADQVFTAVFDPSTSSIRVTGGGSGTVTSIATTAPITGGPITTTGTIACATCLTATAPTNHGVLLGAGTQAVGATAAGTAGNVLTSNGAGADPTFQAAGSGISGLTTGVIPKAGSSTTIVNGPLDDGVTVASTVTTSEPINIGAQNVEQSAIANEGVTGTTLHKLAQRTGAPATWIITTASSTTAAGVCNATCGTAGTPQIVEFGSAQCVFDGSTTAGHYVGVSSTVGDCTDLGATFPTNGAEVVGIVNTTNVGAGTYVVDFNPPDLTLPNAGGGGGGGKSTIQINGTQSKNITNFNSTTPAAAANHLNLPFTSSASGNTTSAAVSPAVSGNSSTLATATGTLTSGHCADFDANGNVQDAGAACGTSSSTPALAMNCTPDFSGNVSPSIFAGATLPQRFPDWDYSFTANPNMPFTLSSVAAGTGVYTGTITNGGSNAYAGFRVHITGFTTGANNGDFDISASTTTTITTNNSSSASETHAATAASVPQLLCSIIVPATVTGSPKVLVNYIVTDGTAGHTATVGICDVDTAAAAAVGGSADTCGATQTVTSTATANAMVLKTFTPSSTLASGDIFHVRVLLSTTSSLVGDLLLYGTPRLQP